MKTGSYLCQVLLLRLDIHVYSGREPWFETNLSYNPAVHRIKQAQFHAAVVTDLNKQPVPPPHPETLKYFDPPRRVIKRAKDAIEQAEATFRVREGWSPCFFR